MSAKMQLGIVGLGSMGSNLAKQALRKDIEVIGVDPQDKPELEGMGATVLDAGAYEELADRLDAPRVIYLSLPAGGMVDDELEGMIAAFEAGDVIMDGGNSFWRDSIRREERA